MNQFEALCKLASDENWCWNIYCTTCGHLHFKYAFQEIARGKSPLDENWLLHTERTQYSDQIGAIPKKYTAVEKENILTVCSEANIPSIASCCKFPDWLGYLGLVLNHMVSKSETFKLVCTNWASQLKDLVLPNSPIYFHLNEIEKQNILFLTIKDLEDCERSIAEKKYSHEESAKQTTTPGANEQW